jgi:catalase
MGYRHMDGFSVNTFKWVNDKDQAVWIKLHYKPVGGIKNFTADQADKEDPDFATRDLFEHISNGKEAVWKAYVQIMPYEQAWKSSIDPFDPTKTWSQKDYPLIEYGRLVLNRNPIDFHAETEQSAFSPAHLVPGIELSPDLTLQARIFSYSDTQRYRLGTSSYQQIPINCPFRANVCNYQRGNIMFEPTGSKPKPSYWPNSAYGPAPKLEFMESTQDIPNARIHRGQAEKVKDDYTQAGILVKEVLSQEEKAALISNLCRALSEVTKEEIKVRAVRNFFLVDKDLGTRLAKELSINLSKIE